MNPRFPAWYAAASIEPKDETLRKVWPAVEKLGSGSTEPYALDLVRMFYGMRPADSGFMAFLESAIQKSDAGFSLELRRHEGAVLAGAAVAVLLEKRSAISDVAALAVVSCHCLGVGAKPPVPEIVQICQTYLAARAKRCRASAAVSKTADVDVEQRITEASATGDISTAVKKLSEAVRPMVARLNQLSQLVAELKEQYQQFREESDVLWWIAGGVSRDLNRPFSALPTPSTCLVAGKELADLAAPPMGPYSAPAFLDKVLRCGAAAIDDMRLQAVVDAADLSWAREWVDHNFVNRVDDLCPIVTALRSRAGHHDGRPPEGVGSRWASALPALALATQAFHEALLLRKVGRAQD